MFTVEKEDISRILRDFGISSDVAAFSELQRYHYEKNDPASKDVRLIIRADLAGGRSVVVRFKHEPDVTLALVNAQCRFAGFLADNGIKTPALFLADRAYARWYTIRGYDVIVTVEAFAAGELREVSDEIAQKTGGLLARMHNIAQAGACHVPGGVLFDPLHENDLFSFAAFRRHEAFLRSVDGALYRGIAEEYHALLQRIRVFENEPKYAVQGYISNCNLYQTADGEIGVFDFNRCGDAVLYYDAVMQAVFEARLMDYPKEIAGKQERLILSAFFRGYHRERPFTRAQQEAFPYLYAMISAFWRGRIQFDEDSLCHAAAAGDAQAARQRMEEIRGRILSRPEMPL